MSLVRLYQFPVSHFCEKVRWALDYKGIPHEVRNLVPMWHMPRMLWLSGQTKLPVIEMEGRVLHGSAAILRSLEERFPATPRLLPADPGEVARLDEIVALGDEQLGPHVRRACYYHVLKSRETTLALLCEGQGWSQRVRLQSSLPLVTALMRKGMRIDEKGYQISVDRISALLDDLEKRLAGRRHFIGDSLSAADITVAALLAPLARPAGTIYAKTIILPEGFEDLLDLFNDRPSLIWTRQLYVHFRQSHCIKTTRRRA